MGRKYLEWLDGGRLLLRHYSDMNTATVSILDGTTLESIAEIQHWRGSRTVADGDVLYGVWEGHLDRVDLNTGVVEELTVFSSPVYGPLALLPLGSTPSIGDTEPVPTTSTVPPATTTPLTPVAAPNAGADSSTSPWLLLGVFLLLGVGVTAALLTRRH